MKDELGISMMTRHGDAHSTRAAPYIPIGERRKPGTTLRAINNAGVL